MADETNTPSNTTEDLANLTNAPTIPTENPLGEAAGLEAEFLRFAPEAAALPEEKILSYRGVDALLIFHNIRSGAAAVLPHKEKYKAALSLAEQERIERIEALAQGLAFAARQVNQHESSSQDLGKKLARMYEIRSILLPAAEACANAGLIPKADVERIKKGKGAIDNTQDCSDLSALYRREATALINKTPATPELIREAAELSADLITRLKPAHAPESAALPATLDAAIDIRNRLWSLLNTYHDDLWKAGALIYGKEVNEFVPPPQSKQRVEPADPTPPGGEPSSDAPTGSI